MKLTVFQADKGDCLLLRGADGTNVLCDGGMRGSYVDHVAKTLGEMREAGEALDLVYVSHIDQDHIAGVLKLVDDEVDWRVYDYQHGSGNTRFKKPKAPCPPEVKAVWHNSFRDQVEDHDGRLEDVLVTAMKASLLDEDLLESAEELSGLVQSKREALQLLHRLSADQLGIPVNAPAGGGLIFADGSDPIRLGSLTITVVGPQKEALEELRKEWDEWLEDSQKTIRAIREEARRDAERLGADEAAVFRSGMLALARELGDRSRVTTPNLASLMLLVEEDGKGVLLTGDGHGEDVLAGLEAAGRLDDEGRLHVDVMKVPHHGSEHNADATFFGKVTADHYVFCADGAHENPDLDIVKALIEERDAASDRPFKLWFNSSEKVTKEERKRHMAKVEQLVERETDKRSGVKFRFLKRGSKLELTL